ncbi:very large low complexity protein [Cordyceps javanica]|uniref:ubiquitinyl hydrolase 1 n=1 Tax=Cordyceps javanica TaxID=43265 RepID=A0A545VZP5_9HYPO|nr:very large low complexity protein [Cordyceps javanica]TQW07159.1 DNL zinc finger domain-containing protein [Cordyceps javanica]
MTRGGIAPIHVEAQNAAIIVSRQKEFVIFEFFELAPENQAVMSTEGRLKRHFPGSAVSVPLAVFADPDLQFSLSETIAKMGIEEVKHMKSKVQKAGEKHIEDRDTNSPAIVTDLLATILSALGKVARVSVLQKNTREQVSWKQATSPWRRSPLWLLTRVTIQTIFSRVQEPHTYKQIMVFLMSVLLELATSFQMSSETLYCMVAKISGRLKKLGDRAQECLRMGVGAVMADAVSGIEASWRAATQTLNATLPMRDTAPFWHGDRYTSYPKLDNFIQSIGSGKPGKINVRFKPSWYVPKFDKAKLDASWFCHSDDVPAAFGLLAFERWVTTSLNHWLAINICSVTTPMRLLKAIQFYHTRAKPRYAGSPEATSLMLLTIMELWVACDKSTCKIHELLREFDHEIPAGLFQSLILPFKRDMERLQCIEVYLETRKRHAATKQNPSIFTDFGKRKSFAVQFFETSTQHQRLKETIESWANNERDKKRQEFRDALELYKSHIAMAAELQHEYSTTIDEMTEISSQVHLNNCERCSLEQKAKDLVIEIHEWPLPEDSQAAKNVVFELQVPKAIAIWRDATAYILSYVLKSASVESMKDHKEDNLSTYLSQYYENRTSERYVLASTTKSHQRSHRKLKMLATTSEDEVLVRNGLQFHYYDTVLCKWASCFQQTDKIAEDCTYQLSTPWRSLQKFLFRSHESPNGNLPNSVISQQSECPKILSLEQFRTIAALPCSYRLQWLNILTQLHMPAMDFANHDVLQILLQIIGQAGPPGNTVYRAGHLFPSRKRFASACLGGLETSLDKLKNNWESYHAVSGFVALASRLLSLSNQDDTLQRCIRFLDKCRAVARRWMVLLQEKVKQAEAESTRAQFLENALHVAQVCVASFDVDEKYIEKILRSESNAAILIESAIAAHDACRGVGIQQWISKLRFGRTLFKSLELLKREICANRSPCLDMALQQAWSAYPGGATWAAAPEPDGHWMTTTVRTAGMKLSLYLQFNLLTGELLVNGNPLSQLPARYKKHTTYRTLFGQRTLEVLPTDFSGMSLCSKKPYHGYNLFFGTDESVSGDLVLLARSAVETCYLVPSRVFAESLPRHFVDDYVHWYTEKNQEVEFRDKKSPWKSSPDLNWVMIKSDQKWTLTRRNQYILLAPEKSTVQHFAKVMKPIEEKSHLHVLLDMDAKKLKVELPRLQLDFSAIEGSPRLYSRHFRDMYVDKNQNIGTLIGLENKLVLTSATNRRKVLIPNGEPRLSRVALKDHVHVSIPYGDSQKVHPYDVDTLLQRLVDDGSLQSKLIICHLHALTSYCLPDELTGKTGTEQALFILRSASLRSFESLKVDDRKYYPEHLQCMETVQWNSQLSFLSQDSAFQLLVKEIFSQAVDTRVFYPGERHALPSLKSSDPSLRNRASIRTASFQVDGFGGENHTTNRDAVYQSRDTQNPTNASTRAFQIADMLLRNQVSLASSVSPGLVEELWKTFSSDARGSVGNLLQQHLCYGSRWMEDQQTIIRELWCQLHFLLVTASPSLNQFQVLMCLCTMAFSPTAHLQAIQCLAAIFKKPAEFKFPIPAEKRYRLSEGREAQQFTIEKVATKFLTSFENSPEYHLLREEDESPYRYLSRRKDAFSSRQNDALKEFVKEIHSQWICKTPTGPCSQPAHLNSLDAMTRISEIWKTWYQNHCFHKYLLQVVAKLGLLPVVATRSIVALATCRSNLQPQRQQSRTTDRSIFMFSTPLIPKLEQTELNLCQSSAAPTPGPPRLVLLLEQLKAIASLSQHGSQREYVDELEKSLSALQKLKASQELTLRGQKLRKMFDDHLHSCQVNVDRIYTALQLAIRHSLQSGICDRPVDMTDEEWNVATIFMGPRRSFSILLGNLVRARWGQLSQEWKEALVIFGVAVTKLQRAERLLRTETDSDTLKELVNSGHTNWNPLDSPESLLLEIESGILIRENQEEIACEMRNPKDEKNVVMQLNMGEGKSSVIVPLVAACLADGSRLVRVVVGKPQAKELLRTLVSKMGGLLDRRIFHMPFSRQLRLQSSEIRKLHKLFQECIKQGGVLLVQPEHILSFKLMAVEYQSLREQKSAAEALLGLYHFFQSNSRDIVDESDENFSPKFELIYTMGEQRSIDFSPERWTVLQRLLNVVVDVAPLVHRDMPESIEITHQGRGRFPRMRVLRADGGLLLLREITRKICATGLPGLPIGRQNDRMRKAVFDYIIEEALTAEQVALVEKNAQFFTESVKRPLLLLRGLIAGGVLLFALRQKRWRVNYGLDPSRKPGTRLAVPYRAKDSPSTRAEFSHPDVVILLTCLSYYYEGLTDKALFMTFTYLMKSDQSNTEYDEWIADAPELPSSFRRLEGVNLKDVDHVTQEVFPHLRQAKSVIDYFLSHLVFPKEMREFSQKLSSSGWDLGAQKHHATTGFSGTNDSRHVLPLEVKQLDIQKQLHTNALVLENLLRPENKVKLLTSDESHFSDTDRLLEFVANTGNEVHVILDIGAQVLELTNIQVARRWLELVAVEQKKNAVVFFDDDDEICVLDRRGTVEKLQTSPYSKQLDRCLVFLDQAHTRGTDLKLPDHYRAAVTLGPDITKDRLAQGKSRYPATGSSVTAD